MITWRRGWTYHRLSRYNARISARSRARLAERRAQEAEEKRRREEDIKRRQQERLAAEKFAKELELERR